MTVYGGLRARLIRDSVYSTLNDALEALGWYEPSDARQAVRFAPAPLGVELEIPLNTLALGDEDEAGEPMELGSNLTERTWQMWVDVYGENDSISLHLVRDVAAVLEGRLPSIDRARPVIEVYDYTLATPVVIFTVEVERVTTDRAHGFGQPWLAHWRSCAFLVVDSYMDDGIDSIVVDDIDGDIVPDSSLTTEAGSSLITEDGAYLLLEDA